MPFLAACEVALVCLECNWRIAVGRSRCGVVACFFPAGTRASGALAGNGGKMAVVEKNSKAEETSNTTTRRKHRKKSGAVAHRTVSRAEGEVVGMTVGVIQGAVEGGAVESGKKRRTTKRDGAARLKKAADGKVAQHTEELAELLTRKALGGDVATARLLVSLAEGGKPVAVRRKGKGKRKLDALIERWTNGPQWQGPMEEERGEVGEGGMEGE